MDLAAHILICLAVGALVSGLVRWLPVPLPLLQTAAGAFLAYPLGMKLAIEPHVFLLLLIPPLLFIDAWQIPKREFVESRSTILLMSFGLAILSVLVVGSLIDWLVPAIPLTVAFALAAALAPTDAVAVAGIARRVRAPRRFMTILQGEALFNDASGLVSLRVAVAATLTGTFSWARTAGSFVLVSIGGIAIGVALTWLFGKLLRFALNRDADSGPRVLLLMLFPYAAYLAAEYVECSGILAAVAAGLTANRFALLDVQHRSGRLQGGAVLRMVEIALNGVIFVLLGLQLPGLVGGAAVTAKNADLTVTALAFDIGIVTLALLALRFVWVVISFRVTIFKAQRVGENTPKLTFRLLAAAAVAGVRGALTLAAALTLPFTMADGSAFPARDLVILFAASVVVVWLIGASLVLPGLLAGVKLPPPSAGAGENFRVRSMLAEAAIAAVEKAQGEDPGGDVDGPDVADAILNFYRSRAAGKDHMTDDHAERERSMRRIGIEAERGRLLELLASEEINEEVFRAFLRQLDLVEEAVAPASRPHP